MHINHFNGGAFRRKKKHSAKLKWVSILSLVTLLRGGEEGKGKTIKRDKYADRKIYIEREMHRTHGPRTERS